MLRIFFGAKAPHATNWANKRTGSRSPCWFQINPWSSEQTAVSIWKSYIWTAPALHRYRRGHGFKSRTGLNFFSRPSFHYCLSSVHNYEDRFHIHVFIHSSNIWLSYTHSRIFTTSRVSTFLHGTSWLVSSVGRALHRYRGGHGFKSRTGLNVFLAFFSLLLK